MGTLISSIDDLPEPGVRWVASRKEMVVVALLEGTVSEDEIYARYPGLTAEELASWKQRYRRQGRSGLRSVMVPHTPV